MPPAAAATGETPFGVAAESSASAEESRWLAALSEPELDLLISLKMLAVRRAETAGRPHLADALDLRMLRALGVVLLEDFKQRLREETSVDATGLDRLALSRDPVMDVGISSNTSSDSEVYRRRSKDQAIESSGVKRKRKQTRDWRHGEAVQRNKKRRKTS
ncbi:hypothetical protein ZWY2020_000070 [Hordeum vulgare]|nr:hypothetical protein ZWY2020_000070 [Hordeum vulgare]